MSNFKLLLYGVLFGVVLFLVQNSYAYDVPKDAVIKVFTKDGKQIGEMSRSEYKVVKITNDNVTVPREVMRNLVQDYTKAKKYEQSHHTVIFQGGVGRDGVRLTHTGTSYEASQRRQPVVGGTYCYTQTKTGVCASAYTNQTYLLGIKRDFNLK